MIQFSTHLLHNAGACRRRTMFEAAYDLSPEPYHHIDPSKAITLTLSQPVSQTGDAGPAKFGYSRAAYCVVQPQRVHYRYASGIVQALCTVAPRQGLVRSTPPDPKPVPDAAGLLAQRMNLESD